jgi:hypothetical protein
MRSMRVAAPPETAADARHAAADERDIEIVPVGAVGER